MLLLFAISASAQAFDWDATALTVALPAASVAVVDRDGGRLLALAEGDRIQLVDPTTGEERGSLGFVATTLAAADVDGDGSRDLLACGEAGSRLWLGSTELQPGTSPCLAAAARPGAIALATAKGVQSWLVVDGSLAPAESLALDLSGGAVLAPSADRFAVGSKGGLSWTEPGGASWTLDAPLVAATASWDGWRLARQDQINLLLLPEDEDGFHIVTAHPAMALGAADIDGDGQLDLLFVDSESGALLALVEAGGDWAWSEIDRGGGGLAWGDLDLDGCDEVISLDSAGQPWIHRIEACSGVVDPDEDGDGWTLGEGDCDDADSLVHPGRAEECDGQDQDCDDQIDETERLDVQGAPETLSEGDILALTVRLEGCEIPWAYEWEVLALRGLDEEDFSRCTVEEDSLGCDMADDGTLTIHAASTDADGAVTYSWSQTWKVANVAPTLLTNSGVAADIAAGAVDLAQGADIDEQLGAHDPGEWDTVRFSLAGAPDWIAVTEEGLFTVDGNQQDSATVQLVLEDDEGARTEHLVTVTVHDDDWTPGTGTDDGGSWWGGDDTGSSWNLGCSYPSLDCGWDGDYGCCCSGSGLFIVLPVWLLRRRRR